MLKMQGKRNSGNKDRKRKNGAAILPLCEYEPRKDQKGSKCGCAQKNGYINRYRGIN